MASHVTEYIHRGKRALLLQGLQKRIEQHEAKRWFWQRLLGTNRYPLTPADEALTGDPMAFVVDELRNGRWTEDTGVVCVGPTALKGALEGIQTGLSTEPDLRWKKDNGSEEEQSKESGPTEETPVDTDKQDSVLTSNEQDKTNNQLTDEPESGTSTTTPTTTADVPAASPGTTDSTPIYPSEPTLITAPPVGFIPITVYSGFRTFPLRLYWWFNSAVTATTLGDATLAVVDGPLMPMSELFTSETPRADEELANEFVTSVKTVVSQLMNPAPEPVQDAATSETSEESASTTETIATEPFTLQQAIVDQLRFYVQPPKESV